MASAVVVGVMVVLLVVAAEATRAEQRIAAIIKNTKSTQVPSRCNLFTK